MVKTYYHIKCKNCGSEWMVEREPSRDDLWSCRRCGAEGCLSVVKESEYKAREIKIKNKNVRGMARYR